MFRRYGLLAGLGFGFVAASSAYAADMPVKATAFAVPPSFELFGGAAVAPHSVFGNAGGVWALNRNLTTDGWLVRVQGGHPN